MNSDIRQQLAPLREELRGGRPEVRPIVQITSGLSGSPETAVLGARTSILEWLRDKQKISNLPSQAWSGESFELDVSQGRPVVVEAHGEVWAMRYDNPDLEVAGRHWRTEAILAWRAEVAMVGVRLSVISPSWDVPFGKSIPRTVATLCERPGLVDYGFRLSPKPWHCRNRGDIEDLVRLLEERRRSRPVYVVSQDAQGNSTIDASALAAQTAGLAHVVLLDQDAGWSFSERVGKTRAAFGGAVRTYNPGFTVLGAVFEDHPIATAEWLDRRFPDRRKFIQLLALKAIDASVSSAAIQERLPDFAQVRRGLAAKRMKDAQREHGSTRELLNLFETDNAQLRGDLAAAEDLVRQLEQRLDFARQGTDGAEAESYRLRSRISQLELALKAKGREETIQYVDSLEDLDDWVNRFLGGRLLLLPRALRSARKAAYEDVRLVCDSLLLLGRKYVDLRLGVINRSQFEVHCQSLGVEVSLSGNPATLKQWREEYEVEWKGEKHLLDTHLKKGTSHDPRASLRIYFFWDEIGEQVVVGHLPDHLTNEMT